MTDKKTPTAEEMADRVVKRIEPFLKKAFDEGYVAGAVFEIDQVTEFLDEMVIELQKATRRGKFKHFTVTDAIALLKKASDRVRLHRLATELVSRGYRA
jgi:hypothetical protein